MTKTILKDGALSKCLEWSFRFGSPNGHLDSALQLVTLNQTQILRTNIGLPARLEGIQIIGARYTSIKSRDDSQSHIFDATRIIINAAQTTTLHTVNPQRSASIVGTYGGRRMPLNLDKMRSIADVDPGCAGGASTIVGLSQPDAITGCCGEAQLHLER